jgi:hypothetical protein
MTTNQFVQECTPEQKKALVALQKRSGIPWKDFIESAQYSPSYVAIPNFHGMFVGIEPDGYTHS